MDCSKISVIVFDLGNVLIPFDYHKVLGKFESIESGLGKKFGELYTDNYHVHRQFEKSEISADKFLEIVLGWLDHKIKKEEFCRVYSSLFTIDEKMVSLLPKLKQNYKLVLISNTNYIHWKYGWKDYDFIKLFDKCILSYEVGSIKPEEKIYKAVEQFTNVSADQHFYTDDSEEYVGAAKKLGWDAVRFTGYDDYVRELKVRGVKV
ncbi:MAG: haloacid dehalogenase [Ignavibacteria bacterium RBG_13_36_8]|nr:MAG: haloacid dehalogenase [Ignavibacteria bacterium RBG_13_36_8]